MDRSSSVWNGRAMRTRISRLSFSSSLRERRLRFFWCSGQHLGCAVERQRWGIAQAAGIARRDNREPPIVLPQSALRTERLRANPAVLFAGWKTRLRSHFRRKRRGHCCRRAVGAQPRSSLRGWGPWQRWQVKWTVFAPGGRANYIE